MSRRVREHLEAQAKGHRLAMILATGWLLLEIILHLTK